LEETAYPDAVLVGNSLPTYREFLGAGVAPRRCKVAACTAVSPSPFLLAVEVFTEQGQSELRMSPPRDFPCDPAWYMCKGHIAPVQHVVDEL
jgi:hypothetical protein